MSLANYQFLPYIYTVYSFRRPTHPLALLLHVFWTHKQVYIMLLQLMYTKDASRVCRRPVIQFGRLSAVERPAA